MDINQAMLIGGMFAANIFTMITLYLHTDNKIEKLSAEQTARTDRLYEMFIDLLKDRKYG